MAPAAITTQSVAQLTADDLHRMHKEKRYVEIVEAKQAGAFNELLGIESPLVIGGQWSQADLDAAYARHEYKKIVAAREAGQLDDLLAAGKE